MSETSNNIAALIDETELQQQRDNNKLEKRLQKYAGKAMIDFNMIEDGDRIMVCLSGGKDSYTMLDILLKSQQRAPIDFTIIAVNLDQKQPGFPEHILPEYLEQLGVEYRIVEEDTYSIVIDKTPEGKTTCGLCSRLRRGILYKTAIEVGATKIALGHHLDDMVETLFLNMFHGARLKSMPAKLISDDKKNIVIRPLAYCRETDIAEYAKIKNYPIIPCNLCGSQENLERQNIKAMLATWDRQSPNRVRNVFKSMQRITPSHLFDTDAFDFKGLTTADADSLEEFDIAFDDEIVVSEQNSLNDVIILKEIV
ncbi:MAG: tRNA 2-thiocytidine biosynthesis protein TtcA [Cocleimonas sp.]|jgi:tRNA 2-thiocytidine biosynthesis protein TtcA